MVESRNKRTNIRIIQTTTQPINNSSMSMTNSEWLERVYVFHLGKCIFHNRPIKIEARDQMDDNRLWVLLMDEWVLGKDAEWHYEPRPSERTDEFIALTRFNSPNEVHDFWVEKITEAKPLHL